MKRYIRPPILLLLAAFTSGGCAWNPRMPSTTYAGVVYNEPLGKPEPAATVGASRDGALIALAPTPSQSLGATQTNDLGMFRLVTRTGYAQNLGAVSSDGRLQGDVERNLKRSNDKVIIRIRPRLTQSAYQSPIDPESHDSKFQRAAIEKILFHYSSTHYKRAASLPEYLQSGVISDQEYESFIRSGASLFTRPPKIRFFWNQEEIVFPAMNKPFKLKKAKRVFE